MGIKIFFATFNEKILLEYRKLFPDSEVNALLSYGTRSKDYHRMMTTNRHLISDLILDSGAFSKNFSKSTEEITLRGFITYAKYFGNHFNYIFNYDEDFNMDGFETNLLNMRKLEKAGIKVVPVVHDYIGQKVREVDYYIKKKYPIIALGFSDHKKKNKLANIGSAVNKIVGAGLKVHLLGLTPPSILGKFPIHYADSSSWAQYGMYGNIAWWNPNKNSMDKTDVVRFIDRSDTHIKWNKHIENYPDRKDFEKYLKDVLKLSIVDVYGHRKDYNRQIANIHYFVKAQDKVRQMHIKKGFKMD
jgi:hypothetical protein